MNEPRFGSNSSSSNRFGAPSNPNSSFNSAAAASNPFDEPEEPDELRTIQARIQASKDSQLESQRRALKSIYESEQLGTGTAEVL